MESSVVKPRHPDRPIRVLVVDDSAFLRRTLPGLLETDPGIKVIGTAENGAEAIRMIKALGPDVVTMDVVMPVMDGLSALKRIMREMPTPVLMLSQTTYEGARQTIEALGYGAVDFIPKPSGSVSLDIATIRKTLIEKVKTAYASRHNLRARQMEAARPGPEAARWFDVQALPRPIATEIVAIAASTGGPTALEKVLAALPKGFPTGMVIVQHIAQGFSEALADKLDRSSPLTIKVARHLDPIQPGIGLLAPSGRQTTVKRIGSSLHVAISDEPRDLLYKPSADLLFSSVAVACGPAAVGVIMTGMGNDGAHGIKEIREQNGTTIAQDEATSLIFGMPRAAIALNAVNVVSPLERIPYEIMKVISSRGVESLKRE